MKHYTLHMACLAGWQPWNIYIITFVFRIPKEDALIFIDTITETNFFEYENIDFIRWTFVYDDVKFILKLKKCSII